MDGARVVLPQPVSTGSIPQVGTATSYAAEGQPSRPIPPPACHACLGKQVLTTTTTTTTIIIVIVIVIILILIITITTITTTIITTIINKKGFPAHDELDRCRTSLVSPQQPVLCIPLRITKTTSLLADP